MTPLQLSIIGDLRSHGPSTAKEIAARLTLNWRSVSNSLTWLRGQGHVTDGSTATPVYQRGRLLGYAHTGPTYPIRWTLTGKGT